MKTLRLVNARAISVGLASQFDVERARADAERARAAIPAATQTMVAVSRHRYRPRSWANPAGDGRQDRAVDRHRDRARNQSPASRRPCWNAAPICSRPARNSNPPTGAVARRRPNGFRALFTSALFGSQDVQVNWRRSRRRESSATSPAC
jgi:hypothetical protein